MVKAKKVIVFKQATAFAMLLVLLLVNTIQLFHTHTAKQILAVQQKAAEKKITTAGHYVTTTTDTKCFICDYQLTKDADHFFSSFHFSLPEKFTVKEIQAYCFIHSGEYVFFETRGPPAVA